MVYRNRRWRNDYVPVNRSGNTIAAQPVVYGTTLFKSKSEARWAILFDTLGVPWAYEPHKFFTGNGGYKPDFQLPTWNVWWEVKGAPPIQAAINAAASVVGQTRRALCISWGQMATGGAGPIYAVTGYDSGFSVAIAQCKTCGELRLIPPDGHNQDGHDFDAMSPSILSAYATARSARWQ